MTNKDITEFAKALEEKIQKSDVIAVSAHINADGDAVGSTLAMAALVEKLGKKPIVFISFKGDKYDYILNRDKLFTGDKDSLDPDLFIVLDCGNDDRLGELKDVFMRSALKFNIDHHISNLCFGDYNLVVPSASSTCELVYEVASLINDIDKYMAECIYTGLITDTSAFKHSCTGKRTMEIAGELMTKGIDFTEIQAKMLYRHDLAASKVFAKAIMNVKLKKKIAITKLSLTEIRSVGAIFEQLDGIAEYCLNINGADVAAFLYEKGNNIIKCSFRSNGIDVNKVASYFGGGGHICAAGCTIEDMSLDMAAEAVFKKLEEETNG